MIPPRVRIDWRHKGGRKPAGVILCSRPSRYGNPWMVDYRPELGRYCVLRSVATGDRWLIVSRWTLHSEAMTDCLRRYREWLEERLCRDPALLDPLRTATGLACYCGPADGCHVDVIREFLTSAASPPPSSDGRACGESG